MPIRTFSLSVGLLYIALGVCGFIDALKVQPWSTVIVRNTGSYSGSDWGRAEWLFLCLPVTPAKNVLGLLIGAAGVLAAASPTTGRLYCQGLCALTGFLALLGLLPGDLNSLWGFLPLGGGNLALHIITASAAFYFGWVYGFDAERDVELA